MWVIECSRLHLWYKKGGGECLMEPFAMAALTSSELGFPCFHMKPNLVTPVMEGTCASTELSMMTIHKAHFVDSTRTPLTKSSSTWKTINFLSWPLGLIFALTVTFCMNPNWMPWPMRMSIFLCLRTTMWHANLIIRKPYHFGFNPFLLLLKKNEKKLLNRIFFDDMVELEELPDLNI